MKLKAPNLEELEVITVDEVAALFGDATVTKGAQRFPIYQSPEEWKEDGYYGVLGIDNKGVLWFLSREIEPELDTQDLTFWWDTKWNRWREISYWAT
jgi:hypothetical protein